MWDWCALALTSQKPVLLSYHCHKTHMFLQEAVAVPLTPFLVLSTRDAGTLHHTTFMNLFTMLLEDGS